MRIEEINKELETNEADYKKRADGLLQQKRDIEDTISITVKELRVLASYNNNNGHHDYARQQGGYILIQKVINAAVDKETT